MIFLINSIDTQQNVFYVLRKLKIAVVLLRTRKNMRTNGIVISSPKRALCGD